MTDFSVMSRVFVDAADRVIAVHGGDQPILADAYVDYQAGVRMIFLPSAAITGSSRTVTKLQDGLTVIRQEAVMLPEDWKELYGDLAMTAEADRRVVAAQADIASEQSTITMALIVKGVDSTAWSTQEREARDRAVAAQARIDTITARLVQLRQHVPDDPSADENWT